MSSNSNNRRRSMSVSGVSPYLSQSDTTSSSLWNSNKPKYFLSRFKSASTTPPLITPSSSTSIIISSSTTTFSPTIGQQQNVKRKPVIPSPTTSRKKYEAVLGIKTEDMASEDYIKKNMANNSNTSSRGFGNLFKKKPHSNSVERKISSNAYSDNNTRRSNTTTQQVVEQPRYELPPLLHIQTQKEPVVATLPNYKPQYHQYEVNKQPSLASRQQQQLQQPQHQQPQQSVRQPQPSRWSTASAVRKSTGSYSIYSTFGSESIYGENESAENVNTTAATSMVDINETVDEEKVVDLAHFVTQIRNPAIEDDEDNDEEDEDDDEEDDLVQNDVFVDATGISQEDMERERIEARLSKRLSGGHFGSAGGLMISIMATTNSADTKRQHKRASRPPPEDLVQSMMNWKRQSGQALGKLFMDQQQKDAEDAVALLPPPPVMPEKDVQTVNSGKGLSVTPSQRLLPPNPEILLSTTEEEEEEEVEKEQVVPVVEVKSTVVKENKMGDEVENAVEDEEMASDDPKECAVRLWHEDETFVQQERIAEWLGQSKSLNTNTLNEYMEYFDFATMRLDSAFRKVCSKLYFRAEAQQIDRILEAFAKRYWQCNPKSIFGSSDIVYAVVYSLLLLNTDLHVAQGSYTRMTRHAFVKNTMSTIREQLKLDPTKRAQQRSANFMMTWETHMEAYLKDMYVSVKNYQILQPLQNQQDGNHDLSGSPTPSATSSKRMSMIGGRRMIDIKRSLNTMIHKSSSTRESMLFLDEPAPRKSTSSSSRNNQMPSPSRRRESFSSTQSGHSSISKSNNGSLLSPSHSHMMSFMDTHAEALFANRPPYLKEGVVMRKHLLESANQKARHREWRECLLVVGQGELKMYGLQSDNDSHASSSSARRNMIRASSASFANLADSLTKNYQSANNSATNINASLSFGGVSQSSNHRWAAYSQLLGSIELNHSLANALPPPGYNRTRPYVFAIQEPNGGVYLIQAASQEQIMEWVSTCNYWAARQSKEPLQGGVSNIEYGWGSCLDDVILDLDAVESGKKITGKYFHDPDAVHISHWIPPTPTMVSSVLGETTHCDNLQKYLVLLNQEINDHREIKKKILVKFPHKSQNHPKALSNWEAKSKYMLHEIIKYQNYCDVLEKSILRREEEEKERVVGAGKSS